MRKCMIFVLILIGTFCLSYRITALPSVQISIFFANAQTCAITKLVDPYGSAIYNFIFSLKEMGSKIMVSQVRLSVLVLESNMDIDLASNIHLDSLSTNGSSVYQSEIDVKITSLQKKRHFHDSEVRLPTIFQSEMSMDNYTTTIPSNTSVSSYGDSIIPDKIDNRLISIMAFSEDRLITSKELNAAASFSSTQNMTVYFPYNTYSIEQTNISDLNNISLDGRNSIINFEGVDGAYTAIQNLGIVQLVFKNCKNVRLVNFDFHGQMFDGLDKNDIPSEHIIKTEYTTNSGSLRFLNSSEIILENIRSKEVNTSVSFRDTDDVMINKLYSKDIYQTLHIKDGKNYVINNSISKRAKYKLFENTYGDAKQFFIGADGTAFIAIGTKNVEINNCLAEEAAANSFRIDNGATAILNNCTAINSRRNGFSVYGLTSETGAAFATLRNCVAKDTGNPLIWNGNDQTNTFNRPYTAPRSYVAVQDGSIMRMYNCRAEAAQYYGSAPPPIDSTQNFNSVVEENIIGAFGTASVQVYGGEFRGYVSVHTVDFASKNNIIKNAKIYGNQIATSPRNAKSLAIINNDIGNGNNIISDNELYYGNIGVYSKSANNRIENNKSYNPHYYGFYVESGDNTLFLDNESIFNDDYTIYAKKAIGMYFGASNSTYWKNKVINESTSLGIADPFRVATNVSNNFYIDNLALSNGEAFRQNPDLNFLKNGALESKTVQDN